MHVIIIFDRDIAEKYLSLFAWTLSSAVWLISSSISALFQNAMLLPSCGVIFWMTRDLVLSLVSSLPFPKILPCGLVLCMLRFNWFNEWFFIVSTLILYSTCYGIKIDWRHICQHLVLPLTTAGPVLEREMRLCGNDIVVHVSLMFRKLSKYVDCEIPKRSQSVGCSHCFASFIAVCFRVTDKLCKSFSWPQKDNETNECWESRLAPRLVTEWCVKYRSTATWYVGSSGQISLLPLKFQNLLLKNRNSVFLSCFLL